MSEPTQVSAIVPIYNEEGTLRTLAARLREALDRTGRSWEVVLVDDGSTDGSRAALEGIAAGDPRFRVLILARNFGQTAALAAGFDHARGEVLVTLDADLQNDPEDIGRLLARLDEGCDVVSGWRRDRRDPFLTRTLPSRIANRLIRFVSGVPVHDLGCTLKAYRRGVLREVRLYGELHRFLVVLAAWQGARVGEAEVRHAPRKTGASKYGLERTFKVLLDLFTIQFLHRYGTKPIYLFGGLGLLSCAGGILAGVVTLAEKIFGGVYVHRNPLILLAVFLFLVGLQLLLMGLLGELLIRIYHESQAKRTYSVRETRNLGEGSGGPGGAA